MLTNKKKRTEYIGFNDVWFSVIGILILGFVAFFLFNPSAAIVVSSEVFLSLFVSLLYSMINWFLNREILIFLRKKYPDFIDDAKRITLFFLAIVCSVILMDLAINGVLYLIPDVNVDKTQSRTKAIVIIIILTIMIMAIYEAVYYNIRLKKSVREEEQAKQAVIQAQLDALRNQAQPHFFFNTLNTLRDIIDQNPKEDATKFVDKLSDMYRFLLEAGNANLITLRDELKFSKAYIHIQSERFGDNLKLNWNIPETALDKMIVPMSPQLLLENAIKHNVISKAKPLEVTISIKNDAIVVENKIEAKSTQLPSTKVGLKNIKNRYALITEKPVVIKNDGVLFSVSLPILTTIE